MIYFPLVLVSGSFLYFSLRALSFILRRPLFNLPLSGLNPSWLMFSGGLWSILDQAIAASREAQACFYESWFDFRSESKLKVVDSSIQTPTFAPVSV